MVVVMTFTAYFMARARHADDADRREHSLPVVCIVGCYTLPCVTSEDAVATVLRGSVVALCAETRPAKGEVVQVFVVDGCTEPVLAMASSMLSARRLSCLGERGLVSSATEEVFGVARWMFYQKHGVSLFEWMDGGASLPSSVSPAGSPVAAACRCPICFGEEGGFLKLAACAHVFHASCIAEWCRRSASCPLCRAAV